MIIRNCCLLLEALSIVLCLHHLYGERFKLDIRTVNLLAVDMIMMHMIDFYGLSGIISILIYPFIVIYCGLKFGFKIKLMLINIVLCVIIIGGIQLIVFSPICYILNMHNIVNDNSFAVSIAVFILVAFILPFFNIKNLSNFLQEKERMLIISIISCLLVIFFIIISYKRKKLMELNNTIILFSCIILMITLSIKLIQYKMKATEIETELKIHKLYSDSLQGLIDDIRLKQHEFDNHINAIYSLHYTCKSPKILKETQKNYCESIVDDNHFIKLLSSDNYVIRGFLYTKFEKISKMGIRISYQVVLKELDIGVPIYRLVEILGDLINNAVEALIKDGVRKKLHVTIMETDKFYLEVRNESPYIEYDTLNNSNFPH